MKNTRSTLLLAASFLTALPLGLTLAQPAPKPAAGAKVKGAKGATKVKGMTKRILTAIEAKTGKALTADQKTRLTAAYRTRQAAIDAADEKLAGEATVITGLTSEDWKAIATPSRKKAVGAGAMAAPK